MFMEGNRGYNRAGPMRAGPGSGHLLFIRAAPAGRAKPGLTWPGQAEQFHNSLAILAGNRRSNAFEIEIQLVYIKKFISFGGKAPGFYITVGYANEAKWIAHYAENSYKLGNSPRARESLVRPSRPGA